MSQYIDPNGEYPKHIGDIQLEYPLWDETQKLPKGWQEVLESEIPNIPDGYKLIETMPIEIDGKKFRNFEVEKYTDAELLEQKIWAIRNRVAAGQMITAEEAKLLIG